MKYTLCAIGFFVTFSLFAQTERITFEAPQLYPEGVVWSTANNCFYVSSARLGSIGKVTRSGEYSVFYTDTTLKSSFGMKIDDKTGMLWFAAGDPNYSKFSTFRTFHKMARVIGIEIKTGIKKRDIDLAGLFAGEHFINDLVLDGKGNIYLTDSYSPVIYKIDQAMRASLFARNDLFAGKDVALNGIVVDAAGYLIVANDATGMLIRVDIKNPSNCSIVKVNGFFPGADGLLWDGTGALVVVQNKGVDKVYRLVSSDHWLSASVVGSTSSEDRFQNPSTATKSGSDIFALNAKLNELSDSIKTPSKQFSIQKVVFH